MKDEKLKNIIYSGLGIALVFVATIAIKIPYVKGYINFGDIFIFIISSIFGDKIGFISGGLGSALADISLGYNIYAPATFVIKGLEGFISGVLYNKSRESSNTFLYYFSYIIAGLWMVLGYFIYETLIYGYLTATAAIFGNLVQGLASALVAIILIRPIKMLLNR
ncbi:Uncharacterized membrane protein [Caloramator fervidus]|uniref:Uncharacterized membrane protein n=1 Tax=Caloramator fervidus TaxID=29344 RepID=A0A1H5UKC4_9CLOT|nr:ECF transporter S component [Caloramator fervidus]SEF74841.1 Uncharacterized membrane protein [Caloramator fervidus]